MLLWTNRNSKTTQRYPKIITNLVNSSTAFSRRCRWCPLGVVGSVISGPFECSCRRRLELVSTEVSTPQNSASGMITTDCSTRRRYRSTVTCDSTLTVEVDGVSGGMDHCTVQKRSPTSSINRHPAQFRFTPRQGSINPFRVSRRGIFSGCDVINDLSRTGALSCRPKNGVLSNLQNLSQTRMKQD